MIDGELIGGDLPAAGRPKRAQIADAGVPPWFGQPSGNWPKGARKIDAELCLICAMNRLKIKAVTFTAEELRAAVNQTVRVTPDDGAYHVITNGMGS